MGLDSNDIQEPYQDGRNSSGRKMTPRQYRGMMYNLPLKLSPLEFKSMIEREERRSRALSDDYDCPKMGMPLEDELSEDDLSDDECPAYDNMDGDELDEEDN